MKKRKYWYHTTITECVLCGSGEKIRQRRYGKKPKDGRKRFDFQQFACDCHFM